MCSIINARAGVDYLKYLTGTGELLTDRLLTFDARTIPPDRVLPAKRLSLVWITHPVIKELVSYEQPVCDLKTHSAT